MSFLVKSATCSMEQQWGSHRAEFSLSQSPWILLSWDQRCKQCNLVLPCLPSTICLVWASLLLTLMVFAPCLGGQGSSGLVEVVCWRVAHVLLHIQSSAQAFSYASPADTNGSHAVKSLYFTWNAHPCESN